MRSSMDWKGWLDIGVAIVLTAGVVIIVLTITHGQRTEENTAPFRVPVAAQSLEGAHRLGSARAPVALIVYSDFECPFCGRFARETLVRLEEVYVRTGRLTIAFRHFPLQRRHPRAVQAAQAAECAG
jgi:protein-disulfide isomerase